MKVRLFTYKSFRHYGGRQIIQTAHIVPATFVCTQRDGSTVVTLDEAGAGHPKGCKIAVFSKNIIE